MTTAEAYRQHEAGYQDRLNGWPPQSSDDNYFQGYCERLLREIATDCAIEELAEDAA